MFGWKGVTEERLEKRARDVEDLVGTLAKAAGKRFGQLSDEINALKERIDELEKVQRTLCDDIYDLQADMTLIHNIEGYEDWRSEIGKPVKPAREDFFSGSPVTEDEWWEQNKPITTPTDIVK